MNPFLHKLATPAPTRPMVRFRARDHRPIHRQVVNGFRIVAGLIGGFLVLLPAMLAVAVLPGGPPVHRRFGMTAGWLFLLLTSGIMISTANRWAPFITGFFFGPALFKAVFPVLLGPDPTSRFAQNRIPRLEAAEALAYIAVVIILTWRFVKSHPAPTTLIDRFALTLFVIATLRQAVIPYHFPPVPLLTGVAALFVAWCVYAGSKHRLRSKSQDLPA